MSPSPLLCVNCGEGLATVTADEVVTTEGVRVRFRRHTDFVVCAKCLSLYRVSDLREGRVVPVPEDE